MENGSDLKWCGLGPIDDQVRVDRKEFYIFVGQILTTVTGAGGSSEKFYFFADGGFNAVRYCEAGLFFDVTARFRRGRAQLAALEQSARSFKFGFQIREVSIQLISRDSFAAVELFDAAPDFCVDYFPVLQEPTILFFLGLQQTEQDFLVLLCYKTSQAPSITKRAGGELLDKMSGNLNS